MVASTSVGQCSPKKKSLKRKKNTVSPTETKSLKLEEKPEDTVAQLPVTKQNAGVQKTECPKVMFQGLSFKEIGDRYPVLMNEELVARFLSVPITNNQKGRLRQVLRDNLRGTSEALLPDVIHNRIQSVLKSSQDLNDTDLRKIRILYNMLNTAVKTEKAVAEKRSAEKKSAESTKVLRENMKDSEEDTVKSSAPVVKKEQLVKKEKGEKKEAMATKVKGRKRYVVFVGNLPVGVDKQTLMRHFSDIAERVVDIRIPPRKEEARSAIAYVELTDEPTYELALSKHHSMLANKRINVQYTTQKKSKVSKTEAKSKTAKLAALQKSGKLIGSTPLNRKRSQRRARAKKALAAAGSA